MSAISRGIVRMIRGLGRGLVALWNGDIVAWRVYGSVCAVVALSFLYPALYGFLLGKVLWWLMAVYMFFFTFIA